ncbi:MAG: hypothetical protein H7249_16865 [Chitinophagaceae bacterium]|nr:hypothetical protein [Oligoflexus sp.]
MNVISSLKIVLSASLLSVTLVGCGSSDNNHGPAAINSARLTDTFLTNSVAGYVDNCSDAWTRHVSSYRNGLELDFHGSEVVSDANGQIMSSTYFNDVYVYTISNDSYVSATHTITRDGMSPVVTTETTTKSAFLNTCAQTKNLLNTPQTAYFTSQIGSQDITIGAGRSTVDYTSFKVGTRGMNNFRSSETWTLKDGSNVEAKSIQTVSYGSNSRWNNNLTTTITTKELTHIVQH